MTLRRRTLTVAALLAGALACWIVLLRGMSIMGGLVTFVGVWATMMAAMMLPAAAPMVAAYAGVGHARASTPAFVLGYLSVWTTSGLAVYGIGMQLPSWSWLAAVRLTGAGLYQLTALKNSCLRRCRAGYCTGLMVALFALGTMNLALMAGVALLILAEKALPGGTRIASVSGVGLIAAGVLVLA